MKAIRMDGGETSELYLDSRDDTSLNRLLANSNSLLGKKSVLHTI